MKKILIMILIIMLVAIAGITFLSGFSIGNFEVLSIENVGKINEKLEKKIDEASNLKEITFPQKESNLNATAKKLSDKKEEYQNKVAYSSEENVRRALEKEVYKVDFLFTRIGNHAKRNGLEVDLDAQYSKTLEDESGNGRKYDYYNLNMTLHGEYLAIEKFVRSIEDDAELGFTIRSFVLIPEYPNDIAETDNEEKSNDTNDSDNNENSNEKTDSNNSSSTIKTDKTNILKAQFTITDLILDVDENLKSSVTENTEENNDTKKIINNE